MEIRGRFMLSQPPYKSPKSGISYYTFFDLSHGGQLNLSVDGEIEIQPMEIVEFAPVLVVPKLYQGKQNLTYYQGTIKRS